MQAASTEMTAADAATATAARQAHGHDHPHPHAHSHAHGHSHVHHHAHGADHRHPPTKVGISLLRFSVWQRLALVLPLAALIWALALAVIWQAGA